MLFPAPFVHSKSPPSLHFQIIFDSLRKVRSFEKDHAFFLVFLVQPDFNGFIFCSLNVFPHIVRLDWKLAMSAVDQNRQLDSLGTTQINNAVQGSPNRSACIKYIIYQNHTDVVDVEINQGFTKHRPVTDCRKIIPIQSNIQNAYWNGTLQYRFQPGTQTLSQRHAPAPDADNGELVFGPQLLNNFGRNPCQHKVHFCGRHQELALDFFHCGFRSAQHVTVSFAAIISHGKMRCKRLVTTYTEFEMLDKKAKVKDIRDLGARNYLLTLSTPEQARLVRPGQFIMLKCVEDVYENPLLRRPFTIFDIHRNARSGKPAGLELLIKDVGAGTHKLVQARPGQVYDCLGPQGRGFQISAEMKNRVEIACLVAGGVGIAPLFLLAQNLLTHHVKPILFYGGAGIADLVLREHFEGLGMETIYTTEDGSFGERGLVSQPLAQFLKAYAHKNMRIYACGPWGMMKAVHALSVQHDLQCEVSLEARMGCSLGACLGCVVRSRDHQGEEQYLRVCQEGPVMNSRLIDWDTVPV
jgi:dihydroorotate dehydrogenase electron transfer subunit